MTIRTYVRTYINRHTLIVWEGGGGKNGSNKKAERNIMRSAFLIALAPTLRATVDQRLNDS